MILAVDASALAAIIFGEPEGADLARYLDGETLVAPVLIDFEIAGIGLKKIRRDPERLAQILSALEHSQGLPLTRVAVPSMDALTLAARTGLSAYDAAYLWVAMSRDAELVTLDDHLARVNQQLRESRIGPP